MDTEEMYRRGIADAEHGEPHPFYYQHYYQYRRAYDNARRSRGLPGGYYDQRRRRFLQGGIVLACVLVALGAYWYWRTKPYVSAVAGEAGPQAHVVDAQPTPSRRPVFATPTIPATPTQLVLQAGGTAQVVNIQGSVLRGRKEPSLKAQATAAFKQGDKVRVLEGPVEADGFTWWKLEGDAGTGWSAQRAKDGTKWLEPVAAS